MSVQQLRAVTYLCPSVPVDLVQEMLDLLERNTGCLTTLQYEWRSDGPVEGHPDPFASNLIDIAFMPGSGYLNLERDENKFVELLPVTPLLKHAKNEEASVGTFVDIVVHADKLKHNVSDVLSLRGCRWACTAEGSFADVVMMKKLHELGENITFFGGIHRSKSHLESVNMVLTKKAEVATIDSSALMCNKRFLHNGGEDVAILTSFGPYSPHAIVVNSRLPESLKQELIDTFHKANEDMTRFNKFGVVKFVDNCKENYETEKELMKHTVSKIKKVPYY